MKELLQKARDLIAARERWTQDASARTAQGTMALPKDPAAVCWCAGGAICKEAATIQDSDSALNALDIAAYGLFGDSFVSVNDRLGHNPILAVFDRAIASYE